MQTYEIFLITGSMGLEIIKSSVFNCYAIFCMIG